MLGAWQKHIYQNQVKSYLDTEINIKEYFGSISGMFWYGDELKKEFKCEESHETYLKIGKSSKSETK